MTKPDRAGWGDFPDVLILKDESSVKRHPLYPAAKTGDANAADLMIQELLTHDDFDALRLFVDAHCEESKPVLVAVHAYEEQGVNAIPAALAESIGQAIGCAYDKRVYQTNIVSHTGADGYGRLARQALFSGEAEQGKTYVMVDDFVGQGGTLANLRGHILKQKGSVAAALTLTGRSYSAKLSLTDEQLNELREKHGKALEQWWQNQIGHTFDRLTQSEARYLTRSPDADRIREKIIAARRR